SDLESQLERAESFEIYYGWGGEQLALVLEREDPLVAYAIAQELEGRAERGESLEDEVIRWKKYAADAGSCQAQLDRWRWYGEEGSAQYDQMLSQMWLERAARGDVEAKFHLAQSWLSAGPVNE